MPGESGLYKVTAKRVHLPPMTFDEMFHWDGVGTMSQDGGPGTSAKPTFPSRHAARSLTQAPFETPGRMATGGHTKPSVTRSDLCPVRLAATQTIDWARE
jgi:hypothetical protein